MILSDCSEAERRELAILEARVGRMHLRQRLGLEGEHEAHVFRQGTHFFHLENWYSMHGLIYRRPSYRIRAADPRLGEP